MAVAAKKLDVKIGDLVEIDGRRYEILPDNQGAHARTGDHGHGR